MLILNIDYKCDWKDIYNYFLLCEYEPKDREKYRYRPVIRKVKPIKALTDNMVTKALKYSWRSKNSWDYNLQKMNYDQFQGFIHILCGLQASRGDYNFFDEQLLENVIDDYWKVEYEKSLTELDKRALNAGEDINYLEAMLTMVETEKLNKDLEIDGRRYYPETAASRDYYNETRQLEEKIKETKQFVEQYEADYDEWIKPIYKGFGDKKDIWPTIEQCNALRQTYYRTHEQLLNSIAVLVFENLKEDWDRIIAYYAVDERRIMLAEKWEFDVDSGDPYIIYPKLKRPITDSIVYGLRHYSHYYRSVTVEQLDNKWEEYKLDRRQKLMFIIFVLQTNGFEIIAPEIYSEVFKKQIERDKKGEPYLGIDSNMIDDVIKNIRSDKKEVVCETAILLDLGYKEKGYSVKEVGEFIQNKLLEGKKAGS